MRVGMSDDTVVILGSRTDCAAALDLLAATGWPMSQTAIPGQVLYGRRLQLEQLIVFDSWPARMHSDAHAREWAGEDLLCRYRDDEAAAAKIGLTPAKKGPDSMASVADATSLADTPTVE